MKKKAFIVVAILAFLILGGTIFYLLPKVIMETSTSGKNTEMTLEEMFTKNENFYVYFYRDDCRYCDNRVYKVDSGLCENLKSYNWKQHELKYDVEIGILTDGDIKYYNGMNEKDIKEKYPEVYYKIVLATEGYTELHSDKEAGKVYAIYTHPNLDETDLSVDNFVLPAIPMLVEFDNQKVKSYYFDDKEIIAFLGCDTEPLDQYWNLE